MIMIFIYLFVALVGLTQGISQAVPASKIIGFMLALAGTALAIWQFMRIRSAQKKDEQERPEVSD